MAVAPRIREAQSKIEAERKRPSRQSSKKRNLNPPNGSQRSIEFDLDAQEGPECEGYRHQQAKVKERVAQARRSKKNSCTKSRPRKKRGSQAAKND